MESRIEIRPGRTLNITTYPNHSSDSTIFFIHGLGGQSAQWREQIDVLKEKYTLIIPDLLGHGSSAKPPVTLAYNPYSFIELENDLRALFHKYASRTNILLGHSYGGALATALAIEHQDQISHLALISPTPCVASVQIPWIYQLPAWLMTLMRPYLEKRFIQLAFTKTDAPELINRELELSKINPMYVIKGMVEGMKEVPNIDITMLTIPTLVMIGQQDQLIPASLSRQFYKLTPYHTFKTIEQAAHLAQLETPKLVNDELKQFFHPEFLNLSPSIMDFNMSIK